MARNDTLKKAKETKNDEYYTQLADIENELRHYKKHFKGKVVFCNCDDPYESNFFKYFAMNFKYLELKKLIATCYKSSPIVNNELDTRDIFNYEAYDDLEKVSSYKVEITEIPDYNNDGAVDLADVEILLKSDKNSLSRLNGDGDFRSKECIELLKEADIVVTNPPFSLFREYIAQLFEYNKKFIIIGNPNALHYKEIFPLVRDNSLWIGYKSMSSDMLFNVSPEFAEQLKATKKAGSGYKIVNGEVKGRAQAIWFTNIDIDKRHEELILYKQYNPEEYPKYTNLDCIEVSSVSAIPIDYYGMMGVPDNFLEYYNPEQFRILGLSCGDLAKEIGVKKNYRGRTDLAYIDKDGKNKCPYSRIVIIRKEVKTE